MFNSLTQKYPQVSFFVNVYAPIMGWDNHASRGFEMFDRLHKKNDMRFNVVVASMQRGAQISKASDHKTLQKLDYVKNICFFGGCEDALKLKEFITAHHGCLQGISVISREADCHVREDMYRS